MRAEYDSSKGKRGALIAQPGKTRITIYIDNAVLDEFRARAERAGTGYQTMMNEALKAFLAESEPPVTEAVLRQVIREELPRVSRSATRSTAREKKRRAG
jgi:BrnA antitoxin of type II toxin-antitoxin system